MKTLILKSLLAIGFILGLSAIACAQEGEKPVYKLRTVKEVRVSNDLIKELRQNKVSHAKESASYKMHPKVKAKELRYDRYESKKEVK